MTTKLRRIRGSIHEGALSGFLCDGWMSMDRFLEVMSNINVSRSERVDAMVNVVHSKSFKAKMFGGVLFVKAGG